MGLRILWLLSILVAVTLRVCSGDTNDPKYKIEVIPERSVLGEGPFWDADAQLLYWVDMKANALNSYDPVSKIHAKVVIKTDKTPVTLVIKVKGTKDRFVVGIDRAVAVVKWDGKSSEPIKPKYFVELSGSKSKSRDNDGKADPANRLWVGTMGVQTHSNPNDFEKDKGGMFLIDSDGKKHEKVKKLQIANGLDWSLDNETFYLVDSFAYKVYEYDYNVTDGSIKNQKVVYDLKANDLVKAMNSLPDGMTIDTEGMLWVSVYGTGKIIRINPKTKEKIFEIVLPKVLQPTSVAFGGKNLDILFATSARVDWTAEFESKYPLSGHTFKITGLGVKGKPSRDAKIDESIWKDVENT